MAGRTQNDDVHVDIIAVAVYGIKLARDGEPLGYQVFIYFLRQPRRQIPYELTLLFQPAEEAARCRMPDYADRVPIMRIPGFGF